MPNIKSAKKRVKVIAVKTARNNAANSALKTSIKKANTAIENNAADKEQAVRAAVSSIDRAVSKGLLIRIPLLERNQHLSVRLLSDYSLIYNGQ